MSAMASPPRRRDRIWSALFPRLDADERMGDASDSERADASSSGAAVVNALSGIGAARDSGAMARPNTARDYLTNDELVALLRGTAYRRIVSLHPQWATVKGWALTDDTDEDAPLAAAMKRIDLPGAIRRADTWGRALGESRILLVTDSDMGLPELREPLDPSKVKRLHRLEVLDRREFTPASYNNSLAAGVLGEPETYHVHPRRGGISTATDMIVHKSRLLRFYGDELPPSEVGFNFTGGSSWGADAIGQMIWDGLRNLTQTGSAGARVAQELSIAVFKLNSSKAKSAGEQRDDFIGKMRTMNMMKSVANAVFLSPSESFERTNASPAGFKDLSEHARMELGLLSGVPLTLLIGLAPGGLNTDGDSWFRMWAVVIALHQEDRYRPPIEKVIEILYWSETGGIPDRWDVSFNPLGEMTALELAEVRLKNTQSDTITILDGVLTVDEVRGRYTETGGYQAELQPVTRPDELPDPTTADPEIEAEARAMAEAAAGGPPPGVDKVSDLALNGAQVQQAIGIVEKVALGILPRDTGVAALVQLFTMPESVAEKIMGSVGRGFRAAPEQARADAVDAVMDAVAGAAWLGLPLPSGAIPDWTAARDAVSKVAPLGDIGDPPHVTLMFLGELDERDLPALVLAATDTISATRPIKLETGAVLLLGDSVVLEIPNAWELDNLHRQLLPRLAHLITYEQHPTFRAHTSLGKVANLTPEQRAAILEVEIDPFSWTSARVEIRHGSETVATVPMVGREDVDAG